MTKIPTPPAKSRANPGRRLETARRASGYTRQDIASRLKIPLSAVKYIDRWDLEKLPARFQTKPVLRQYALLVGLNPADFESEFKYVQPPSYQSKPMIIFSKLSLSTLAVLTGLLVMGFLVWRAIVATAKPILNISQPESGLTTAEPTASVIGQTSEQAQVYVNGFNVPVDPEGKFNTSVILRTGVNTINITAINRFGRQSQTQRIVNYSP